MNYLYVKDLKLKISKFFKETYATLLIPVVFVVVAAIILNIVISDVNWGTFILKSAVILMVFSSSFWMFYMSVDEKNLIKSMLLKVKVLK